MFFGFHWLDELVLIFCIGAFFLSHASVSRFALALIVLFWIAFGIAGNVLTGPVDVEFTPWLRWFLAIMTVYVVLPMIMQYESRRRS